VGSKPRMKMPLANRAKQFMPFAALRGFEECLAARERPNVPRRVLACDMEEKLNRELLRLSAGDVVLITHYCNGQYLKTTGEVSNIDLQKRELIVGGLQITFADIFALTVLV